MPVALVSAPQAGATSPVTLAGSVVLAMAECLAGLVFAVALDQACRVSLGTWPLVSDLRTGAMSAGSAELALMMAGGAQLASFYRLPGSVAGGMTDAKVPDAQSGAEKATTLTLAAHAGSALILESAGMQASLMSTALESYVIDDDLLAAVERTLRGIEVSDETLSVEVIRETVAGDGHFLGHPQTHERMKRDYFYPAVGDRQSPAAWEEAGGADVRERARQRVRELLGTHYPDHLDDATDARIREAFDIRIPRDAMRPGTGRW
jgi:trimethylamine--corrinoid protein Co-methyltransferase